MATALMAYEARVDTTERKALTIEQLLGDGSNGAADHALAPGEMIPPWSFRPRSPSERAAYRRAISRTHAEWPLVEVVLRVVVANGAFRMVRIAAGGVAPVPLRLSAAEALRKAPLSRLRQSPRPRAPRPSAPNLCR